MALRSQIQTVTLAVVSALLLLCLWELRGIHRTTRLVHMEAMQQKQLLMTLQMTTVKMLLPVPHPAKEE